MGILFKTQRSIWALAIVVFSLSSNVLAKNMITEIRRSANTADDETMHFASDSWMRFGKVDTPVMNYNGQWRDGLAHGRGEIIIGTDWERPRSDPSTGRMLQYTNFGYMTYRGRFINGQPSGVATISQSMDWTSIERDFTNEGPQLLTRHIGGHPVVTVTIENSVPVDGPLKMRVYPDMGNQPSKIFYGVLKNGVEQGEWVSVPWTRPTIYGEILGFKNFVSYPSKSGERYDCEINPSDSASDTAPSFKDLISAEVPFSTQGIDKSYSATKVCNTRYSGWYYQFRIIPDVRIEAVSCADPTGNPGKASITDGNVLHCAVTQQAKKSNNIFAKIFEEIKRTPDNVGHGVTHTIDELGEEFSEFLCNVAQKTPGKDCHVNVQGGVSIPIPESTIPTSTIYPAHLQAVAASQELTVAIHERTEGQTELSWASNAADLYSLCVDVCSNKSKQEYSLSMVQLMNRALGSAGNGSQNFRTIASFNDDLAYVGGEILSKIPFASTMYTYYKSAKTTTKFDDALLRIQTLSPVPSSSPEGFRRSRAFDDLFKIKVDYLPTLYKAGVDVWAEYMTMVLPNVSDPLKNNPYIKVLDELKINRVDFIKAHGDLKSPEEFFDALIAEKLKDL